MGDFLPGFQASFWVGIGVPNNTPADIVDRLNKEISLGLADPKMKARLPTWAARRSRARPRTSGSSFPTRVEKWGKVVKFGAKPETRAAGSIRTGNRGLFEGTGIGIATVRLSRSQYAAPQSALFIQAGECHQQMELSEWVSRSKRWRSLSRGCNGKTCPMLCNVIRSSYFSIPWEPFLLARNGPKCANCANVSLVRLAEGRQYMHAAGPVVIPGRRLL